VKKRESERRRPALNTLRRGWTRALHSGDFDAITFADNELPGVADCGGAREVRDFCVRNAGGSGEFIGEGAEAGARTSAIFGRSLFFSDERAAASARTNSAFAFAAKTFCRGTHVRIPTMQAEHQVAMVPASMARMPNLASWLRCSGASAPMPPIECRWS